MTKLLGLLTLFITWTSFAQTKHIVLDLDSTLVQGIPRYKLRSIKKTYTFSIRDGRWYNYALRPHLVSLIKGLSSQPNTQLHIASDLAQSLTYGILKEIEIDGTALKDVIEKANGSIFTDSPLDLSPLSPSSQDVIFITSKPERLAQVSGEGLSLGQYQYYFDDYSEAQSEIASLTAKGDFQKHQKYLPPGQDEFDNEYHKLARLYLAALRSLKKADFASTLKTELAASQTLDDAISFAENNYQNIVFRINGKSCNKLDIIAVQNTVTQAPMQECVDALDLPLRWNDKSCAYVDRNSNEVLTLDPSKCVAKLPVEHYWNGPKKDQCSAFAKGNFQAGPKAVVADANCGAKHAIYDAKKDIYHSLSYFTGLENLSIAQILRDHLGFKPIFSLAYYDPQQQNISGVNFPRNNEYLWRGMDKAQFDLPQAVRAMLGDDSSNIESKAFTHIKLSLMQNYSPFSSIVLGAGIDAQIAAQSSSSLSEAKAVEKTKKILDAHFLGLGATTIINQFLNYWSPAYADWNHWGVFTSIAPAISFSYAKSIFVSIREKKPRSSDLNYYNYVTNSSWKGGFGSGHHGDTGEFIAPGHIQSEDISGYFETDALNRTKVAFLKFERQGESYIAGIDSPKEKCLVYDKSSTSIKGCAYTQNYSMVTNTESGVRPAHTSYPAHFIIKLCKDSQTCSIDKSLAKSLGLPVYANAQRGNKLYWLDRIKNINIKGLRPKVFTDTKEIPAFEQTAY